MKKLRPHIILMLLCAALFYPTSCSEDTRAASGQDDRITVRIAPTGEAPAPSGDVLPDNAISTFRLLIFNASTGRLAYNKLFDMSLNPVSIEIQTGDYRVAFIANEDSDQDVSEALNALTVGTANVTDLHTIAFDASSFSDSKNIPMAGYVENVSFAGEGRLSVGGIATPTPWDISPYLLRLGVRVDLHLTTNYEAVWTNFTGMRIENIPSKVYLLSHRVDNGVAIVNNNGSSYASARSISAASGDNGTAFTPIDGESGYEWAKARIILPSNVFADADNAGKALRFCAVFDNEGVMSATVGVGESQGDYTAPRNTHFSLEGEVNDLINFSVSIASWGDKVDVVIPVN